jgi:hypothetical protein
MNSNFKINGIILISDNIIIDIKRYYLYLCGKMWKIDLSDINDMQSTFDRLYEKKAMLQKARPLPKVALQKIKESLSIEWTYNSNSIEGNTLNASRNKIGVRRRNYHKRKIVTRAF